MERLLHFLESERETGLPIVAEARGKNEDNTLRQVFSRLIGRGTEFLAAEQFRRMDLTLTFQPKRNNIAGNQVADLCAYPCARHILSPARQNRAYEIAEKKVYRNQGITGWKLFP